MRGHSLVGMQALLKELILLLTRFSDDESSFWWFGLDCSARSDGAGSHQPASSRRSAVQILPQQSSLLRGLRVLPSLPRGLQPLPQRAGQLHHRSLCGARAVAERRDPHQSLRARRLRQRNAQPGGRDLADSPAVRRGASSAAGRQRRARSLRREPVQSAAETAVAAVFQAAPAGFGGCSRGNRGDAVVPEDAAGELAARRGRGGQHGPFSRTADQVTADRGAEQPHLRAALRGAVSPAPRCRGRWTI